MYNIIRKNAKYYKCAADTAGFAATAPIGGKESFKLPCEKLSGKAHHTVP